MRIAVFLLMLAVIVGKSTCYIHDDVLTAKGLEGISDVINSTLNKVIKNLPDPLKMGPISKNFSEVENMTYIKGAFNLSNVILNGLRGIVATKIKTNVFSQTLNMTILIPDIVINFKYWADLVIEQLIPFYGLGRNNIDIENLEIMIYGKGHFVGGMKLSDVKIKLSIGSVTFELNGILNNPELSALLNTALNDNFGKFINSHSELISNVISPIVQAVINSILNKNH